MLTVHISEKDLIQHFPRCQIRLVQRIQHRTQAVHVLQCHADADQYTAQNAHDQIQTNCTLYRQQTRFIERRRHSNDRRCIQRCHISRCHQIAFSLIGLPTRIITRQGKCRSVIVISRQDRSVIGNQAKKAFLAPLLLRKKHRNDIFFLDQHRHCAAKTACHVHIGLIYCDIRIAIAGMHQFDNMGGLYRRYIDLILCIPFILRHILILKCSRVKIAMAFIRAPVIQYDAIPLKCNIAVCDHRGIVGLIL